MLARKIVIAALAVVGALGAVQGASAARPAGVANGGHNEPPTGG